MKKLIFVSILCLIQNAYSQNSFELFQNVLNKEFEDIPAEDVIFRLNNNNNISKFIIDKNEILNKGRHEYDYLLNCLGEKGFKTLFSNSQLKEFEKQYSNNNFIYYLDLPKNIKQECYKSVLYKNNLKKGLPPDTGIYYFSISNLLISKDSEYILFEYSKGVKGNMLGGIKLYKRESNNNYMFLCETNTWME